MIGDENLEVNLLEKLDFSTRDDEFSNLIDAKIKGYKTDTITLIDNGTEGVFIRPGDLDKEKLHPMITLLHGGPFGSAPLHGFFRLRNFFLLQGYCLLVINFRGSTGYGEKFMNALLGNCGVSDVEDCGNLTKKVLE